MNKTKIKKVFKDLLKEDFGNKIFIDNKLKKITDRFYLNKDDSFFIEFSIRNGNFNFNCNYNIKLISRLGYYTKIVFPRHDGSSPFFNGYTMLLLGNYGTSKLIFEEKELVDFYYGHIPSKLKNVILPRAEKILTIADCFELNKSRGFQTDIINLLEHLLYAKLINPAIGNEIEEYAKKEALYLIGEKHFNDKNVYVDHKKFTPIFNQLCAINQEQELEQGRLLESDLIVTTRNEEWPTLDPDFKELIDPEVKKMIYG